MTEAHQRKRLEGSGGKNWLNFVQYLTIKVSEALVIVHACWSLKPVQFSEFRKRMACLFAELTFDDNPKPSISRISRRHR